MKRHLSSPIVILALCCSLAANAVLYYQYRHAVDINPDTQAQVIIEKLKQTTSLPDEKPSVLTVFDKDKLTNPAYANLAQDGDLILIFQEAAKAVVYRPQEDKLVDIVSLTPVSSTPTPQPSASPTVSPSPDI